MLENKASQNTLTFPIDKMLYIYVLCQHSELQKKFRSNLNTFTKETSSNKVKTSKSWIQCNSLDVKGE
jgi:hypothetical protein